MRISLHSWLSFSIASAILCLGTSAMAQISCEGVFESKQAPVTAPDHPTVRITEVRRINANEAFYVLRRITERSTWLSTYSPRGFDPQGSPMWGLLNLGEDLGHILGFRLELDGSLLAPTPETAEYRLAKFNRFLVSIGVAPIPLHFYLQLVATRISFLDGWGDFAGSPVNAGDDNHTLHDISYHYPSILLPVEIIQLMQTEAQIARAWVHFLKADFPKSKSFPRAAEASVRLIDENSVSANRSPGKDFTFAKARTVMALYFPDVEGKGIDLTEHAHRFSPLDVFYRRITYFEKLFPQHDEVLEREPGAKDRFFAQMKTAHPEWTSTVASRGLSSPIEVRELYLQRADVLRNAAERYRKIYGDD